MTKTTILDGPGCDCDTCVEQECGGHVCEVQVPGIQGPKGDPGDITPELQELHDEAKGFRDEAESASQSAAQSASDAAGSAGTARAIVDGAKGEIEGYASTLLGQFDTAKQEAHNEIVAERDNSLDTIKDLSTSEQADIIRVGREQCDEVRAVAGEFYDQAQAAADAAKASEAAAKASENAAKTSETNAKASETAAKASETAAKASEVNAKASATSASVSAASASASQSAAKTSETNAKASETAAKASENAAKTSETNAGNSATAAAESEELAEGHKEAASASASAAATSETNTKASEIAAKTSETNAKTSETNAAASASSASDKATEATNQAELAKNWATKLDGPVEGPDGYSSKYWAQQAQVKFDEVVAEGARQVGLVQAEGNTQVTRVTDTGSSQVALVESEGDAQVERVVSTGNSQVTAVTNKGTEQVGLVTAEGTKQTNLVKAEGQTQTANAQAQANAAAASATAAADSATAAATSAQEAADVAASIGDPLGKDEAALTYATKAELNNGLATKLNTSGGAVTGTLTVSGTVSAAEPTASTHVATKNYVDTKVSSVYRFKGTVASQANLPTADVVVGDTYNVADTGKNYSWDGTAWDDLGGTVDLSAYATKAEVTTGLAGKANSSHNHTIAQLPKASTAQAEAGTDDATVMTPAATKAAILALSPPPDLSPYATKEEVTTGLAGKANSTHSHAIANVTGLQDALDGKQAVGDYATNSALTTGLAGKSDTAHTHTISALPKASDAQATAGTDDTTVMTPAKTKAAILALSPPPDLSPYATTEALTAGLAGKANSTHSHAIADVSGLQDALNGKQAAGDYATNSALTSGLAGKANSSHTHSYLPLSGGTVSGTIRASSFQATSDARRKENFRAVDSYVDAIMTLSPYEYNFIGSEHRNIGLIAQDILGAGIDHVVFGSEDTSYSVDYNAVVALLVGAVGKLKMEVEQLRAQLFTRN